METAGIYVLAFLAFLTILLVIYYLLPAGIFYLLLYRTGNHKYKKIQTRSLTTKQIKAEVKLSLFATVLFAIMLTCLYWAYQNEMTKIYTPLDKHGYLYLALSPLILVVLHDVYFYWTHRLLHTSWMFRRIHRKHHSFTMPSPWAIYAFHPVESFIQFAIYPIIVFLIPVHPLVLALVLFYSAISNAGGHCGYEIVPASWRTHWLLRYNNTVRHHDMHHSKVNCNYSLYFNVWDRLLGTFRNH